MDGRVLRAWRHHRAGRAWLTLAVLAALLAAGCGAAGTSKSGGAPEAAAHGTVTLTFASGDLLPVDATFMAQVARDSGGHLRLRQVSYNGLSPNVDQVIASALQRGKLAVADVGSRAWDSVGAEAFSAYQAPFLISSRELLDQAVTGRVESELLASLKSIGITGLAIVPLSIRYIFSTRPLVTPAQFVGAKIRIHVSDTTSNVLSTLGAIPVTTAATGPAVLAALRDGALTGIESDPFTAVENGYVEAAPYVVVNAPLFARTTTFAVNSKLLARLPAADAGWLREAAEQAASTDAFGITDQTAWASACGAGLKPQAITQQQFITLHNTEASVYADLSSDQLTTLVMDQIGGMATSEPRMDSWATCHGVGVTASPTRQLDGTYTQTVTEKEDIASGDPCTNCGNAGTYRLVIDDGRYALYKPVQIDDTNTSGEMYAFQKIWRPADPIEVGTISIAGDRLTYVPEVNQQFGSAPGTYTFVLYRGVLTLHLVVGGDDFNHFVPWRLVS
jgi:TRAP-type C4-dicarboxylate transport system substrate-binding protein